MKSKVSLCLSRVTALALFASPFVSQLAHSQEVYSQIVGAMAVDIPGGADRMIAFPFKHSASFRGPVASVSGDSVTLVDDSLDAGAFGPGHFLYVEEAATASLEGRRLNVVSNTASTIKVDLDGSTLAGLANGDRVSIRSHWTLAEAFPGGIGAVEEKEAGIREIEVIVPTKSSVGGGIRIDSIFYYYNDAWREFGKPIEFNADNAVIEPGSTVVIRNNGTSSRRTYVFGEVVDSPIAVAIQQDLAEPVDNFVSLERPLDLKLSELNLIESGAFAASTSDDLAGRKDVLAVYNREAGQLSSPVAQYYYNGTWKNAANAANANDVVISAGMGLAIRKAAGADTVTYWINNWNLPSAE